MNIVYLVTDHGEDGRAPESIVFASLDREERDSWYQQAPSKAWYSTPQRAINLDQVVAQAMTQLTPVEHLVLTAPEDLCGDQIVHTVLRQEKPFFAAFEDAEMGTRISPYMNSKVYTVDTSVIRMESVRQQLNARLGVLGCLALTTLHPP